ncbi:MAG: Dyp-type peroxidase, partial [Rhodospirillales bacterium]|nr:Dyp-type peroxidase [Rhodospirillales bacterium]
MSAMCPGRRLLLRGLAASPAALIGTARAETLPDDRGIEEESTEQRQPFYGAHQAGIVTPQPAAALVASFDVLADNRTDLERMFRTLTQRIAFLTTGGTVPSVDPKLPPLDSGLMGPRVFPDNLTMTVAVGTSLF